MSDFDKMIPRTSTELGRNLTKLHENRKHIKKAWVDLSTPRIYVDLSGTANFAGNPDFYIPLKASKAQQAKIIVDRILNDKEHAPTSNEVEELFGCVDLAG